MEKSAEGAELIESEAEGATAPGTAKVLEEEGATGVGAGAGAEALRAFFHF